ncbi:hypothetical protein [Akkermansia sp.]
MACRLPVLAGRRNGQSGRARSRGPDEMERGHCSMNADQMEIPLPAPVLHALTEEAKKFGLSCEEYLKKIVIGIMKDELEKKKFLLFLDAKKHADRQ